MGLQRGHAWLSRRGMGLCTGFATSTFAGCSGRRFVVSQQRHVHQSRVGRVEYRAVLSPTRPVTDKKKVFFLCKSPIKKEKKINIHFLPYKRVYEFYFTSITRLRWSYMFFIIISPPRNILTRYVNSDRITRC